MAKKKERAEMISPKKYAEIVKAQYPTVMLWLRQNLIPGATRFPLPTGGHYYLVPSDAPKPETRRGPKPKSADEEDIEASQGPISQNALGRDGKPRDAGTGGSVKFRGAATRRRQRDAAKKLKAEQDGQAEASPAIEAPAKPAKKARKKGGGQ